VVEAVAREFATTDTLVFAGFSQGTAMACRAAALGRAASSGIVLVGGDLPEELKTPAGLRRAHCALIGRGLEDRFLTAERMERDAGRLREAGVAVRTESVAGGHEWNASMGWVVGDFLLGLWEMELNEAPVDADPGRHDNGGDRAE
jgi:predicted esterase